MSLTTTKFRVLLVGITLLSVYAHSQQFRSLLDSVEANINSNPDKALFFGVQALNLGYEEGYTLELLKLNSRLGQIFYEKDLDAQSLKYFNESLKIFKSLPYKEREDRRVEYPPWLLLNIGNVYYKNSMLDKAKDYYGLAIDNFNLIENEIKKNHGLSTSYDNLGLIHLKEKRFVKAKEFFTRAYNLRLLENKSEDILYSMNRFLEIYISQDEFKAVKDQFSDIKRYYNNEKKYLNKGERKTSYLTRNFGFTLKMFSKYLINKGFYEEAVEQLNLCVELLESFQVHLPSVRTLLALGLHLGGRDSEALVIIDDNLEDFSDASFSTEIEKNLSLKDDILMTTSPSKQEIINSKNTLIDFYKKQDYFSAEADKLETTINFLQTQEEISKNKSRYNVYIVILILVVFLLSFLFYSAKLNLDIQSLKINNVENQKKLVEMELENKKLALANTNNFISQQSQNLKNILKSSSGNKDKSAELQSKIKMLTKSFKLNDNFEKLFEEVYPGFYRKLIQRNKNLTQNDLKLCACIRLNQTSKEIAFMMGISSRTIESQKYRLKKKLGLSKEERLTSFIFSI